MVRYRRNFLPGGTFFFTVTLDDRRSSALIDHIGLLRAAFRGPRNLNHFPSTPSLSYRIICMRSGPYRKVMQIFPTGGEESKVRLREARWQPVFLPRAIIEANTHSGKSGSGNIPSETRGILNAALTTSISIRSSTGWCRRPELGRFPRCIDMFEQVCCLAIGAEMAAQIIPPVSASGRGNPGFRFAPSGLRSNADHPPFFSVWSYTSRATWFSRSLSVGPDST